MEGKPNMNNLDYFELKLKSKGCRKEGTREREMELSNMSKIYDWDISG